MPCWNTEALRQWWDEDTMNSILTLPLGATDQAHWKNENAGTCSIKNLYRYFTPPTMGLHLPWDSLWSLNLPSKHKIFIWKCLLNRLPTRARLQKFIPFLHHICVICHREPETTDHLMGTCKATIPLWLSLQRHHLLSSPQLLVGNWFWNQTTDRLDVVVHLESTKQHHIPKPTMAPTINLETSLSSYP